MFYMWRTTIRWSDKSNSPTALLKSLWSMFLQKHFTFMVNIVKYDQWNCRLFESFYHITMDNLNHMADTL